MSNLQRLLGFMAMAAFVACGSSDVRDGGASIPSGNWVRVTPCNARANPLNSNSWLNTNGTAIKSCDKIPSSGRYHINSGTIKQDDGKEQVWWTKPRFIQQLNYPITVAPGKVLMSLGSGTSMSCYIQVTAQQFPQFAPPADCGF